MLKKIRF